MSKAEGKLIGIKFNLPINTLTLTPTVTADSTYTIPTGTISQSAYYQTNTGAKAFDNNLATYWYNIDAVPQWIMIELTVAKVIAGFRIYTDQHPPNGVDLYGSNDGTNFDLIIQTTNTNNAGWKEHSFEPTIAYKYYKWVVTSKHGAYIRLYEVQLLFTTTNYLSGNESAFIISGNEYEWLDGIDNNGELISKTYAVSLVQTHPTEPNAIQLVMGDWIRNSQGLISINYNQALGNLAGTGGAIASFTETFTPTDLKEGLTEIGGAYGTHEYIDVIVSGTVNLVEIEKIPTYNKEYIEASIDATIELKHINDINP